MAENKGSSLAIMMCNGCGKKDVTFQERAIELVKLQVMPTYYIDGIKAHYKKLGWDVSWGHDLCPDCVEKGLTH